MSNKPKPTDEDETLAEYDFSQGMRGKHHQAHRGGFTVRVQKEDGTVEERDFALPPGLIALDPDVAAYFPNAESVNRTLRGLIELLPRERSA